MYLVHCTGRGGPTRRFAVSADTVPDEARALLSTPYAYPTKDAAVAATSERAADLHPLDPARSPTCVPPDE